MFRTVSKLIFSDLCSEESLPNVSVLQNKTAETSLNAGFKKIPRSKSELVPGFLILFFWYMLYFLGRNSAHTVKQTWNK